MWRREEIGARTRLTGKDGAEQQWWNLPVTCRWRLR